MKNKNQKKESKWNFWLPPKGSIAYFLKGSSYEFYQAHPIGYIFVGILGLIALLSPAFILFIYIGPKANTTIWDILGIIGSFIVGIGMFNFVAIIVNQYLGHLVSIISFLLGGGLIMLNLHFI